MKKILILFVVTLLISGFVLSAAVHSGAFSSSDGKEASSKNDKNVNVGTDTDTDIGTGTDTDTGIVPDLNGYFNPLYPATFIPDAHENLFKYSEVSLIGTVSCDGTIYDSVVFDYSSEHQAILFSGNEAFDYDFQWHETNMAMGSVTFEPGYIYYCYYRIDYGEFARYDTTRVTDEETGEPADEYPFTLLDSAGNIVRWGSGLVVNETFTTMFYLGTGRSGGDMCFLNVNGILEIYVVRLPIAE